MSYVYTEEDMTGLRGVVNRVSAELTHVVPAALLVGAALVCGMLVNGAGRYFSEAVFGAIVIVLIERHPDLVLLVTLPTFLVLAPTAPAKALEILPALLLIETISRGLEGRYRFSLPFLGLVSMLAIWCLASYLYSSAQGAPSVAISELINTLLALGFVVVAAAVRPKREWLLTAITFSGLAMAFAVRTSGTVAATNSAADNTSRVGALGLNPNGVGLFVAIGTIAAIGKLITTRRPVWLLAIAAMLATFPAAKSRSSLIIVAAGLAGFVIFSRSRRAQVALTIVTAAVFLFIPHLWTRAVNATLEGRTKTLSAQSDASRSNAVHLAVILGFEHPVIGIGWGQFPAQAAADPKIQAAINTHDDYAKFLSEAGFPALLLFLGILWMAFRAKVEDNVDWAMKALLCAMAVSMVTANVLYNIPTALPYMAVVGSLIGTDYYRKLERIEVESDEHQPTA